MVLALLLFLSKAGEAHDTAEARVSLSEQPQPCVSLGLLWGSSPNLNFPTPLTQLACTFSSRLRREHVDAQLLGSFVLFLTENACKA